MFTWSSGCSALRFLVSAQSPCLKPRPGDAFTHVFPMRLRYAAAWHVHVRPGGLFANMDCMCCEFICATMEYFYGFNVSGVMTLRVQEGEALSVSKSVKRRKFSPAFRGTWALGPQRLKFVLTHIYHEIRHLCTNLGSASHVPAVPAEPARGHR